MRDIEGLALDFCFCSVIGRPRGAFKAIEVLQSLGGEFFQVGTIPEPDPAGVIDSEGNIIAAIDIRHRLLPADVATQDEISACDLPADTSAWASFSFFQESQWLHFAQDAAFWDQSLVDGLAIGQLNFGRFLYPHLRAKYGWIDESGLNKPKEASIWDTELEYLFWANFFGREFVRSIGEEFLGDAPAWRVEGLPDNGMLLVATESFRAWRNGHADELLEYFRSRVPKIDLYRAEEIP
jgi:hypothetical protein